MRPHRAEADEHDGPCLRRIEKNGCPGSPRMEIADTGERAAGFAACTLSCECPRHQDGAVEDRWRMATPQFWGKGYVTEAARRWRDHGFDDLQL